MKKIKLFEPLFFIFFGLFHLHRIWGLFDRKGYADFWLGIMEERGVLYYVLMIILASLCIAGIIMFLRNLGRNYLWRWIYIFGGLYLLFDLIAIMLRLSFWHDLILLMYDTAAQYWNILWSGFILIGAGSLALGIYLLNKIIKLNK